jgi:hypothetical protein
MNLTDIGWLKKIILPSIGDHYVWKQRWRDNVGLASKTCTNSCNESSGRSFGSAVSSLAGSLRFSRQPAAQDGLTRQQLHRITLRIFVNRLPGHLHASSRPSTTYSSWSYGPPSHGLRTTPAAQQPNATTLQHASRIIHFPVPSPKPFSPQGGDVGTPTEHINPSTMSTLRGILYSRPHLCRLLTGTFWCKLNVVNVCPCGQRFH